MLEIFGKKNDRSIKNIKYVYKLIYDNQPVSKYDLQEISGIKLTTLSRYLYTLMDHGLIKEIGYGESTGGRRPNLYSINKNYSYIVGVDISRTYYKVNLINLIGEIVKTKRFEMKTSSTPEKVINDIVETINIMLEEIPKNKVLGVGIGCVGPLDRGTGKILNPYSFPAEGWYNVPITESIEEKLGIMAILDNGTNAAVFAEYFTGAKKHYSNIAYINLGVGIRSGVIVNGEIVRTVNDLEDAMGHMIIDMDGERCYCGNYGCLDTYVSINSIVEKFKRELKKGKESKVLEVVEGNIERISALHIFDAANKKDMLAAQVVTDAATVFGIGLANFINLLNTELVIISGPIIKYSDMFFDICTNIALKKNYSGKESRIVFSKGNLGEDAISIGAGLLVVDYYLRDE